MTFEGRPAVITGTPRCHGHHLNLRFDGETKVTGPFHPLWEIDYLDGTDHGAEYDARIEAFNARIAAGSDTTEGGTASKPADALSGSSTDTDKAPADPSSEPGR